MQQGDRRNNFNDRDWHNLMRDDSRNDDICDTVLSI